MKLFSFQANIRGETDAWVFNRVEFKDLNLIVGDSCSGKSRFLNTLFNIGRFVCSENMLYDSEWVMEFAIAGRVYTWEVEIGSQENEPFLKLEKLKVDGSCFVVEREGEQFRFNNNNLPKLMKNKSAITLLKEEDTIQPIYKAFQNIFRRNFSSNILYELFVSTQIQHNVDMTHLKETNPLWAVDIKNLNAKLYFLQNAFPDIYEDIIESMREVFPFIESCEIKLVPIQNGIQSLCFFIKEKNIDYPIPLPGCSSGLKKTLLFITDIKTLPEGALYLIDEYENSLGVNAIDYFPEILFDSSQHIQFIITSHHPYIINHIPVENWLVFSRKGSVVDIRFGEANKERYGYSKQKKFIQLINDPFYKEGVA
ncbi:AAA family ATPase [bacterium]|nr:AAA family ATPase [bacterium]